MHVHLVKALENNYPSLLYTRPERLQRARLIGCEGVAFFPPLPAVSVDLAAWPERRLGLKGRMAVCSGMERGCVGFLGNCGALQIRWAFNLSLKGAAKRTRRLQGATAMGRHIQKQKNFLTNKQTRRSYWETEGRARGGNKTHSRAIRHRGLRVHLTPERSQHFRASKAQNISLGGPSFKCN